jgi:hypothetical protein
MAMRVGRKIKWDPQKEAVVGDPDAQAMTWRPMRPPWRL